MLTFAQAWSRLRPTLRPLPSEMVDRDLSTGRVLSEDLSATLNVPPTDVSAMDGFALPQGLATAEDIRGIIGPTIAAGDAPGVSLVELQKSPRSSEELPIIARIMTGAPVPEDCDRVIPVELAVVQTEPGAESQAATVRFPVSDLGSEGQHIRRQGEVSRSGDVLISKGQSISTATTSLLATHGIGSVPVHRLPTVAFATTGSEIVAPSETPAPGQIRDSHSSFFRSSLLRLGIEGQSLGLVEDSKDALRRTVEQGLAYDVLILSGGVSKGEYDLVEGVLAEFDCEVLVDSVSIQPGKPTVIARRGDDENGSLVFGLPGNPAAAQVTFRLFVQPALETLYGHTAEPWGRALDATLTAALPGARGRDRFLPCALSRDNGNLLAEPRPPRGSHDVLAYGTVNGLVYVPAEQRPRSAGERCSVLEVH